MFIVFMLSRLRRVFPVLAVMSGLAVLTSACEKVPLLAPTGSTITLTTATTGLPFNSSTDVIAQVIEASGTPPHSGTQITFTTSLGTIQPASAETDLNGRATVKFVSGTTSGTATITAISGGASVSATGALKIAVGAAAVTSVVASASPATVSATGGSSTISAKVADAGGNALAGIPVTFTTDFGSLTANIATTDQTGTATTVLTTNKTAKVTAAAGVSTTTSGTGGTTSTTTPPTATVTVSVNATSSITIGSPSPATPTVNQTVSFPLTYPTSTTGASAITRLSVDWGDGRATPYTGAPPSIAHAYSSAGSYLIVVVGIDAFGDTATSSTAVTVAPRAQPTVTISASATPQPNAPVTFTIAATATAGNTISRVDIDYGDGSGVQTLQGNATSAQHVYSTASTYTVTAVATDTSGSSGSGSTVIVVGGGTTADFTISPATGVHPASIGFNASSSTSSSPITNYVWDFGDPASGSNDSASGSSTTQSHTYNTAGTFTVTLTITDSAGRTATKQHTVTIT